jgi:hypothetical protein
MASVAYPSAFDTLDDWEALDITTGY